MIRKGTGTPGRHDGFYHINLVFLISCLIFLSQILISVNLVLLQRTQEDESHDILFDIVHLCISRGKNKKIHYAWVLGPVYTTVEKSTGHEKKGRFSIVIGRKCNS